MHLAGESVQLTTNILEVYEIENVEFIPGPAKFEEAQEGDKRRDGTKVSQEKTVANAVTPRMGEVGRPTFCIGHHCVVRPPPLGGKMPSSPH